MKYSLSIIDLVGREEVRDDEHLHWARTLNDEERSIMYEEMYASLREKGVKEIWPDWKKEILDEMENRETIYLYLKSLKTTKTKDDRLPIFIGLTRLDLIKYKKDIPIDDIDLYSFRSSSLDLQDLRRADVITFIDSDGVHKDLKNRYAVWPTNN